MGFRNGAAGTYPEGLVRHVQEFAAVFDPVRRRYGEAEGTLTPQGNAYPDSDSRLPGGRRVSPHGAKAYRYSQSHLLQLAGFKRGWNAARAKQGFPPVHLTAQSIASPASERNAYARVQDLRGERIS